MFDVQCSVTQESVNTGLKLGYIETRPIIHIRPVCCLFYGLLRVNKYVNKAVNNRADNYVDNRDGAFVSRFL